MKRVFIITMAAVAIILTGMIFGGIIGGIMGAMGFSMAEIQVVGFALGIVTRVVMIIGIAAMVVNFYPKKD